MYDALYYMLVMIDNGYDFADALYAVSAKYKVSPEALTEAYDTHDY